MGKIQEALERAEAQRADLGGAPGGPAIPEDLIDRHRKKPRRLGRLRRRRKAKRKGNADRAQGMREARRSRVVLNESESVITEQFRSLRARIQSIRRSRPIRSIVVTSALAREGKTTTTVNLALSFGLDVERNTCLVDADLRTPRVHRVLPEPPGVGLAEVLERDVKLDDALQRVANTRLWVLPVRALPPHPSELLASRRMAEVLDELHSRFDTVLIDSPPIVGLPDSTTLVDLADAALLVVGAGRASAEEIASALERVDYDKVLGAIFNRCETVPKPYGRGYGEAGA